MTLYRCRGWTERDKRFSTGRTAAVNPGGFYDFRSLTEPAEGPVALHAKCVVVDGRELSGGNHDYRVCA